ncbi:MAG: patatin-like phospholipase family protein [Deltaproteobacteria bacterium]|nr:patatin-like phospholipase family protein [Deltaproteobacteria bacterium]
MSHSPFDAAVFAGGGCRCFWQLGFWSTAASRLGIEPERVGAVSAGAAMACAALTGVFEDLVGEFTARIATNRGNFLPRNWLRGLPAFPHERIYRATILAITSASRLAELHRGPDVRVLLGRPPARTGRLGTLLLGFAGSYLEQFLGGGVHAVWGRRCGFRPELVSVRECASAEELAALLLHSSCTPPALPLYLRDGRPVLDGGIVDGVPVEAVEPARRTLVLLTRRFAPARLPRVPGRVYVQPSAPIPIDTWDYASPALVHETFALGARDGLAFAASHRGVGCASG